MSLFGSKKKTEAVIKTPKEAKAVKAVSTKSAKPAKAPKIEKAKPVSKAVTVVGDKLNTSDGTFNTASVILRPRITEKSGILSQGGVYTFEVTKGANKNSVASAVKALYKVIPVKVAILNNPARNVFIRGRRGVVPGVRKALVTLKKGDKIDFV